MYICLCSQIFKNSLTLLVTLIILQLMHVRLKDFFALLKLVSLILVPLVCFTVARQQKDFFQEYLKYVSLIFSAYI